VDEIDAPPSKTTARRYEAAVGGMSAHAAIAAARLGAAVRFWGRVGDDPGGDAVAEALAAEGVDTTGLRQVAGARTALSAVIVDKRGERAITTWRGEGFSADPSWLPLDMLDGAGAVLTDPRWPEGAAAVLNAARARGVPAVLDAEKSEARVLMELVPLAGHAVFAERGLAIFAPGAPAEALRRALDSGPLELAAVTRGERGVLWLARGMERPASIPAFPVDATNTTGAGDVFHGAYAVALAERMAPPDALRFASAAGALRARDGATPTRAMVDALLKTG
jgi:sulfofructose kinase